MRPATQVIRAGLQPKAQGKPFSPGVTFAGTYHASGDIAEIPYTYGRYHNPTWTQFESALAELESGTAISFASGMAAVAGVFGSTLKRGDILVMPSDSYYTARLLADGVLLRHRSAGPPCSYCGRWTKQASRRSTITLA